MNINNNYPDLTIALDPEAFEGEVKNAATRRYLAEAAINALDAMTLFTDCTLDELIHRLALARVMGKTD